MRETQEEKRKTKGSPLKMKQKTRKRNRQFNVISRTKVQYSPKYLQKILQKYFTYGQVPGYVNRYWECMYKRRTTHLAM